MRSILGAVLAASLCLGSTISFADAVEKNEDKPEGIIVCEGVLKKADGSLSWKTARFSFNEFENKDFPGVNIDGLEYGSGGYLFNRTMIAIHAPEECFIGDSTIDYEGCNFIGVIDRVDGSFTFYKGDDDGNKDAVYFWSQPENGRICRKGDRAF